MPPCHAVVCTGSMWASAVSIDGRRVMRHVDTRDQAPPATVSSPPKTGRNHPVQLVITQLITVWGPTNCMVSASFPSPRATPVCADPTAPGGATSAPKAGADFDAGRV